MKVTVNVQTTERALANVQWPTWLNERPHVGEYILDITGDNERRIRSITHSLNKKYATSRAHVYIMILTLDHGAPE